MRKKNIMLIIDKYWLDDVEHRRRRIMIVTKKKFRFEYVCLIFLCMKIPKQRLLFFFSFVLFSHVSIFWYVILCFWMICCYMWIENLNIETYNMSWKTRLVSIMWLRFGPRNWCEKANMLEKRKLFYLLSKNMNVQCHIRACLLKTYIFFFHNEYPTDHHYLV